MAEQPLTAARLGQIHELAEMSGPDSAIAHAVDEIARLRERVAELERERDAAEAGTEWGVRFSDGDAVLRDDRADAEQALSRYRDTDPDAHLVTRTITCGPWQPVAAEDGGEPDVA